MVLPMIAIVMVGGGLVACSFHPQLLPPAQRCVATADDASAAISLEQSHFAALIAGLSVQRGLAPRAASIALATAYQESGIRNLDHGDRDSLGLFQQRPSQGWGTPQQIMDPYYATAKFYQALVKVPGWQSGDINDVAQKVQRSGVPDGYRQHIGNARVLASALTGESPAAITCLDRSATPGKPAELIASLQHTLGLGTKIKQSTATTTDPRPILTVVATGRAGLAWATATHAVANSAFYGIDEVRVADRQWIRSPAELPAWEAVSVPQPPNQVTITLRTS